MRWACARWLPIIAPVPRKISAQRHDSSPLNPAGLGYRDIGMKKAVSVIEWDELRSCARQSPLEFMSILNRAMLSGANYRVLLQGLESSVFPTLYSGQHVSLLLLGTLKHCLTTNVDSNFITHSGLPHLVLDALLRHGERKPHEDTTNSLEIPTAIALLCDECLTLERARMVPKLLHYCGSSPDLLNPTQRRQLVTFCEELLARENFAPLASILLHFYGDEHHNDALWPRAQMEDLMLAASDVRQDDVSQRIAAALGRSSQVTLVHHYIGLGRLKPGLLAVRRFRLADTFPTIEKDYRRSVMSRLLAKGLWGVAETCARGDRQLQADLIREMIAAGELSIAREYLDALGLDESSSISFPSLDEENIARELQARAEKYLPLPPEWWRSTEEKAAVSSSLNVVSSRVTMVTGRAAVECARNHLLEERGDSPLGIDVEWKPQVWTTAKKKKKKDPSKSTEDKKNDEDRMNLLDIFEDDEFDGNDGDDGDDDGDGISRPAALLQISSRSQAFLFDLLELENVPEMQNLLRDILRDPSVLKLGFDVSGDIKVLRKTWQKFDEIKGVIDLKKVFADFDDKTVAGLRYRDPRSGMGSTVATERELPGARIRRLMGLSKITELVLGKPLDKAVQVSNWEQRPLTARQVAYAALDAYVLVALYDEFTRVISAESIRKYIK